MSIPIAAGGAVAPVTVPVPAAVPAKRPVSHSRWMSRGKWPLLVLALVLLVGAVFLVRRLMSPPAAAEALATEVVALHDLSQTVDATGTVEAVEVVEIKSKASGQILKMPVAIGSVVKAGDLLAQIDPLTVRNQYNQLSAALQAAQANATITVAAKKRADELYSREAMTAADYESAQLGAANAAATLARARADLVIAKQSLDDATVRAPSAGTIVEQDATKGMVITSGASAANGGTTLFKTADLNRIQMQALVGETDVGSLAPGMSASVTVDAFPNHTFPGHIIKIEPQAVVQQSVTMFPVLIAIENVRGELLPGMNGEVTINIARRTQVVAVPLDAVRSVRELPSVAATLGLDANALHAEIQRQQAAKAPPRAAGATDTTGARRRGAGGAGRGAGRGAGGAGAARSGAGNAQFVMVQTPGGLEARLVRLGISDFDYAEVLSGVQAGESVALLSVAEQVAKRTKQQAQMAQRVGNGLPGSTGSTGSTGGGGRGGGGGAPAGGGH
jgi:HlyD family secretion protein